MKKVERRKGRKWSYKREKNMGRNPNIEKANSFSILLLIKVYKIDIIIRM